MIASGRVRRGRCSCEYALPRARWCTHAQIPVRLGVRRWYGRSSLRMDGKWWWWYVAQISPNTRPLVDDARERAQACVNHAHALPACDVNTWYIHHQGLRSRAHICNCDHSLRTLPDVNLRCPQQNTQDAASVKLLSCAVRTLDILEEGVSLVENLEIRRQVKPMCMSARCPSEGNVIGASHTHPDRLTSVLAPELGTITLAKKCSHQSSRPRVHGICRRLT